jgi:hypothetical protein
MALAYLYSLKRQQTSNSTSKARPRDAPQKRDDVLIPPMPNQIT